MTIDSIASSGAAGLAGRSVVGADSSSAGAARAAAPAAAASTAASIDTRNAVKGAAGLPTDEQLAKAVSDLNKSSQDNAQGVEFSIDKDTKRTVVKVVDQATKEVLRQMPTQEALEIAKSLDKLQQGRLINQTA